MNTNRFVKRMQRFAKLLAVYESTSRDMSWIGSIPPEEWEETRNNYHKAYHKLLDFGRKYIKH